MLPAAVLLPAWGSCQLRPPLRSSFPSEMLRVLPRPRAGKKPELAALPCWLCRTDVSVCRRGRRVLVATATLAVRGYAPGVCRVCVRGGCQRSPSLSPTQNYFLGGDVRMGVQCRPQLVVAATAFQALLGWRDSGTVAGAAGRLRPPGFALEFAAGRDTRLLIVISLCHKCQTCLSL